jgi:transcriptional regulator with XRE-family HTH domain
MSAEIDRKLPLSLKRMKRAHKPAQEVIMLERLIAARVMNGFTGVEAAERFGYGNSSQLSLIETGKRPIPQSHEFILHASQVYAVSTDFLFGISTNPDLDPIYAERYALMRGFETVLKQQAQMTTTAFFHYAAKQAKISRTQYQTICESIDSLKHAIQIMRDKFGFDEIQGGASVLAALERTEHAIQPVKTALAAQIEIETLGKNLALGKSGPIAYLLDDNNGIYLEP